MMYALNPKNSTNYIIQNKKFRKKKQKPNFKILKLQIFIDQKNKP